jgi:glyoxylate reductase
MNERRFRALITHPLIGNAVKVAQDNLDCIFMSSCDHTPESLAKALSENECEALICELTDRVNSTVINSSSRLKIIANRAVGYDNIDIKEAKARGIIVTNTPDVLTRTTAELTIGLIFAVARRICEAERWLRAGNFKGFDSSLMLGRDIQGARLGIVGFGRIGQEVAKIANCIGMEVVYYARRRITAPEFSCAQQVSFDELLTTSDIISLHVPLNESTYHLIDSHELGMMKKGAILINTARGPVVNEQALIQALKSGKLAGAGLDVYEHEPLVPKELLAMENVVLLPHIGSASFATRERMALMAVENVIAVASGNPPLNPVLE